MPEFTEQAIDPRTGNPVHAAKPPQHPDEWKKGVYACGLRRDHRVRVHRSHWPPRAQPGLNGPPYVSGPCERCGALVLIYDPPGRDVTVVLYGEADEAQGRVEDEVGQVIEDAPEPVVGQVIDEPEPKRGRR